LLAKPDFSGLAHCFHTSARCVRAVDAILDGPEKGMSASETFPTSMQPPELAVKLSRLARLLALDDKLLRRLVKNRRVRVTYALRVLCRLVDPDMVIMAVTVALFSPALVGVANRAVLALVVTSLVVVVVKRVVRRHRPSLDIQASVPPDKFSFPSGHTAAAFALAIAMFGVVPLVVPPMLLIACLVGYGRMYLGVHYPIDVAVGAAIGLLCGSIIAVIDLPEQLVYAMAF
jgi:undecaprenyl-diphosphatase